VADPPTGGVAGHPLRPLGWLGHHQPPQWPKGCHPLLKKKKKKNNVKEEGWPIHPQGVASHPLGHGGGSATTKPAGMEVAKPPPWPKRVVRPPPVLKKKKKKKKPLHVCKYKGILSRRTCLVSIRTNQSRINA
jgi:hypothetical protein